MSQPPGCHRGLGLPDADLSTGPDVLDGSYKLPVTVPIGAAETREITREAYTYGFPLVETYKTLHKQAIDNARPSFGLIVHHTDAEREYGYDAKPMSSGRLVTALAAASKNGSTLVDMKADWKIVFPETK